MSKNYQTPFLFGMKKYWEIVCFTLIVLFYLVGTLFFVFLRITWSNNFKPPCCKGHPAFSVNITGAEEDDDGNFRTEDGLVYVPGTFYKSGGSVFGCPCLLKPCVRKCCNADEKFDMDSENLVPPCVKSNSTSFNPLRRDVYTSRSGRKEDLQLKLVQDDHFVFLHGNVCTRGDYFLDALNYEIDRNFLMEDGRLMVNDSRLPFPLDQSQYCLESFLGEDDTIHAVACYAKRKKDGKRKEDKEITEQCKAIIKGNLMLNILAVSMSVSILFLIMTLIVFILFPKIRSSHGICLMCYIGSLSGAFAALNILQYGRNSINTEKNKSLCILLALLDQYAYLSSLLWLNVIGFDIWRSFRTAPQARGTRPKSSKGMIYRCIYAFGLPLSITLATVANELTIGNTDSFFKPNIGLEHKCWFAGGDARWLYFYCPTAIVLTINLFMFLTTMYRIYTRQRDTAQELRSIGECSNYQDKNRLWIAINLFSIMGLFWVLEPVSYFAGEPIVFWVSDVYNSLQGVVVFALCVWRQPDLLLLFKERFRPPAARRESVVKLRFSVSSTSAVETSPL